MREDDCLGFSLPSFVSRRDEYDFLFVLNVLSRHIGWSGKVEAYYPHNEWDMAEMRAASIVHIDGPKVFVEHVKKDIERGEDFYQIRGLREETMDYFGRGLREEFLSYLESVGGKVSLPLRADYDSLKSPSPLVKDTALERAAVG